MKKLTVKIPKRLNTEPLIEAIWQIQFDPVAGQLVGDLLPGVLYTALRNRNHPNIQLQRLPSADIPAQLAQGDPNLRYIAKYRIEEPEKPFLFQVGDRIVTLNCRNPYVGWDTFKNEIITLISILTECNLVPVPDRHSIRYIDLLDLEPAPDLSSFRIDIKIGELDTHSKPLQLRIELSDNEYQHVVQFASPAQASLLDSLKTGSIVDIETSSTLKPNSWEDILNQLDPLHDHSKRMFFEHIISQQAIERLDPEY